jgi:putative DNA primase/helicase
MNIEHRPAELLAFHARVFGPQPHTTSSAPPDAESASSSPPPPENEDAEFVNTMFASKNGARIRHLWNGGAPASGDTSGSGGDHALLCELAWWTNGNATHMERLFRQSPRMEAAGPKGERYLARSIKTAIAAWRKNQPPPPDPPPVDSATSDTPSSDQDASAGDPAPGDGEVRSHSASPKSVPEPPPVEVPTLRPVHFTDLGNAVRLVRRFGEDLRYVYGLGWIIWDGIRWCVDRTGIALRLAKATIVALYAEASTLTDDGARAGLVAHAKASESNPRLEALLAVAESEPGIATSPDQLDSDPWFLNVKNGVVDLRTGQLRSHRRSDLITKLAPVVYNPNATLELWNTFVAAITNNDADQARFLQRACGYSSTGITQEEKFFIGIGGGATGKSTFASALDAALGDYALSVNIETFLHAKYSRNPAAPSEDIARLRGARFVYALESPEGRSFNLEFVKRATGGGDPLIGRFPFARHSLEFIPELKLWLLANHPPRARIDDDAFWRRACRIPFLNVIPPERRDPTVKARLRDPQVAGPAIIAWLVHGCLDWQRHGLPPSESVAKATTAYREEMDPLQDFFAECCVFDRQAWTATGELRAAYDAWCRERGEKHPVPWSDIAEALRRRGCEAKAGHIPGTDKRPRGWQGITLQDTARA